MLALAVKLDGGKRIVRRLDQPQMFGFDAAKAKYRSLLWFERYPGDFHYFGVICMLEEFLEDLKGIPEAAEAEASLHALPAPVV